MRKSLAIIAEALTRTGLIQRKSARLRAKRPAHPGT